MARAELRHEQRPISLCPTMSKLGPTTLTLSDQRALLLVVQDRPREEAIISLALGTDLRLAELVGLDVGGVFLPGGARRTPVRLRGAS